MKRGQLEERVAIVTGGSSGIGRGIALEFAREGAKVVVADLRENPKRGKYFETDAAPPTVAVIDEMGMEGLFVQADVGQEEAAAEIVDATVNRFGSLDILVNNAGIHIPGNSQEISLADWDRVQAVNLRGIFLMVKASIPLIKKSAYGRIINISSIHAFAGCDIAPPYSASKAGLVNLSRAIALEVAERNVTVNTICPGYIETAIQDYQNKQEVKDARKRTPLPRFGKPHDIGRATVFLASDDASWITGTSLIVDGGWTASTA